jgi:hypothetical protein
VLTTDDFRLLLQLIASDRVSLRGNEVAAIFNLQRKLALTIDAATKPPKDDDVSHSPGLTE